MSRFKETADDIAVKDRLWASTEVEALRFAEREAEEFVIGHAYSDGQKDVTAAAKKKGYPIGLIRKLGRALRLQLDEAKDEALNAYRILYQGASNDRPNQPRRRTGSCAAISSCQLRRGFGLGGFSRRHIMAFKIPTRADDEALLQWLQWRDEGFSCGQIGAHVGLPDNRIRTATNRVYEADTEAGCA